MLRHTLTFFCVLALLASLVTAEAPAIPAVEKATQTIDTPTKTDSPELEEFKQIVEAAIEKAAQKYAAVREETKKRVPIWRQEIEKTHKKHAPLVRHNLKKARKATASGVRKSLRALRDTKVPQVTYQAMAALLIHLDRSVQLSAKGVNEWIDKSSSKKTEDGKEAVDTHKIAKHFLELYEKSSDEEKAAIDEAAEKIDQLVEEEPTRVEAGEDAAETCKALATLINSKFENTQNKPTQEDTLKYANALSLCLVRPDVFEKLAGSLVSPSGLSLAALVKAEKSKTADQTRLQKRASPEVEVAKKYMQKVDDFVRSQPADVLLMGAAVLTLTVVPTKIKMAIALYFVFRSISKMDDVSRVEDTTQTTATPITGAPTTVQEKTT